MLCSVVICAAMTSCLGAIIERPLTMQILRFYGESSDHFQNKSSSSNDRQYCFISSMESGKAEPRACPFGANQCYTTIFNYRVPGRHGLQLKYSYGCSPNYDCDVEEKKQICAEIAQFYPYPVFNCEGICCTKNNCNTPVGPDSISKVAEMENVHLPPEKLPSNGVKSCYTNLTNDVIMPFQCSAGSTECMHLTFDYHLPGKPVETTAIYGCVDDITCSGGGKICEAIARLFAPIPISNCKLDCCTTDNCNIPEKTEESSKVTETENVHLPPEKLPSNYVKSCYASVKPGKEVPVRCAAGSTECLSVTFDYHLPGEGRISSKAGYGCFNDYSCEHSGKNTCDYIARLYYPIKISNCKVSCCTTDNCNYPGSQSERDVNVQF